MFRRQSTSDGTDNDLIIIGVLRGAGVGFEPSTRAWSRLGFADASDDGGGGVCGLSSGEAGLARQALRAVHRTFVSA